MTFILLSTLGFDPAKSKLTTKAFTSPIKILPSFIPIGSKNALLPSMHYCHHVGVQFILVFSFHVWQRAALPMQPLYFYTSYYKSGRCKRGAVWVYLVDADCFSTKGKIFENTFTRGLFSIPCFQYFKGTGISNLLRRDRLARQRGSF